MFHSLGLKCKQNGEVQLLSMPGIPILTLNTGVYSKPLQIFSVSETQYKWHKSTTEEGLRYGKQYSKLFPELFSKHLRRNDFLSKTTHKIDTGDHPPIKIPPRRYSPSQQQAIRDFCKAHQGTLIKKSKRPWAAPLLLTPK